MKTRALLLTAAILLAAVPAASATLPGKNGSIAFSISPHGGLSDIWTVKPNGRGERRITRTSSFSETNPSFSPDGRRIAFVWTSKNGRKAGIGVMSARGGGIKHLISGAVTELWTRPAWSPDGRSLYYSRAPGLGAEQVYRIPATGGSAKQITNAGTARDPLTSGDRSHLLFYMEDENTGLAGGFLSDLGGGAPAFTGFAKLAIDWSPDAKRVLFVFAHDIYSCALDGSDRRRLDSLRNFDEGAVWSPDGKKVVFFNGAKGDLMVMNADGSHLHRLMHGPGMEVDPAWQPR